MKHAKSRRRDIAVSPVAGPPAAPREWKHALLFAALLGFTFMAYSNSFEAPFLLDNKTTILQDARIREATPANIHRILTEQYSPASLTGLYRPLTTLSYLFNYAVLGNGEQPAGYHWFNFLLHALNMALVYALGRAILERPPVALLMAAIWGLHPVLTESVTNIVGRADMMAAFGVLAALLCHRQAVRAPGGRKALWLAAMALAVTAGMWSKESAIVVVAVIALYDFTFGRTAAWRSRIPSYLAVAVPCLVFLAMRARVLAHAPYAPFPFVDNPLVGAGFWTARMTAVKVLGRYFQLLAWPTKLSCDYSYNEIPLFDWGLTWEDWKAIGALVACLAAAAGAAVSYRRHKAVFFFLAFFFVTLAPTSNLVMSIGSIMGERFLYLPSLGFAACAACGLYAVWRRLPASRPAFRYAAGAALGVVLMASAARTHGRTADWLDLQRFWRSAAEAAPGSFYAHISAATSTPLVTPEDWDRSIAEADRALAILDGLPDLQNVGVAYIDAGFIYRSAGERPASAKSAGLWYGKSLRALLRAERIELAQDQRNRRENARRGMPDLHFVPSALYLQMGLTYMRLSDVRSALAAFERGRALAPDPDLLEEMATAYRAAGEPHQAALALVEAMAVDSSRARLTPKLLELYREIDPAGCAVSGERSAPGLNVDCPLVHGDICTASRMVAATYLRRGQPAEAAAIRQTAVNDLGCAKELVN